LRSKILNLKTHDKQSLENKLKSLEGNIALLENFEEKKTTVVNNNIRESKIKEIKNVKENLIKKYNTVEEQISELLEREHSKDRNGFNVKSYLHNFDKDKKECEKLISNYKEKEIERENKIKEKLKKIEDEHQAEYMKQKTEEKDKITKIKLEHINISKKMNERNNKIKIELDESRLRSIEKNKDKYLYNTIEVKFSKREHELEEKKKKDFEKFRIDRKDKFHPIRIEELLEHTNEVNHKREELLGELEKKRIIENEKIKNVNEQMTQKNEICKLYNDAAKQEKEARERLERIKLEQQYNSKKIKKYSNIVAENMAPTIDELKRKQILERVDKLMNPKHGIGIHHYDKHKQIKLLKFTEESKKKYKWDVDLKKSVETLRSLSPIVKKQKELKDIKDLSRDNSKIFHTEGNREINHDDILLQKSNNNNNSNSNNKSQILILPSKRTPLTKKPDYLTKMRKDDEKRHTNPNLSTEENNRNFRKEWEKIMNKNSNIFESVEEIKSRTKVIEQKMNFKEKFLKYNGGAANYPEIGAEITTLLTNSIQAKLLLLEKMNE